MIKRVILNDPLKGRSVGKVNGGKFLEGGGWQTEGPMDRIVFELPERMGDGCLEFDLSGLDPANQPVPRNFVVGMWETLWKCGGDRPENKLNASGYDTWLIRLGKAYGSSIKLEMLTFGVSQKEVTVNPLPAGFDPKHVYHFKVEWVAGKMTYSLDGKTIFEWNSPKNDPMDHFRFVHIGTVDKPEDKETAMKGMIYSNLKVTAYGPAPAGTEEGKAKPAGKKRNRKDASKK
ncbi:MAG: hypothetical protein N3D11_10840 [Candidatus Sumerlaeia bacterium]|nr:hypothetical protein [Candidatus Sumerlaeia bacterium]